MAPYPEPRLARPFGRSEPGPRHREIPWARFRADPIDRIAAGGIRWAAAALLIAPLVACSGPVDDARRSPARSDAPLAARLVTADPAAGAGVFRQCAACHTVAAGAGDRDGPNLYGLVGRRVAFNGRRYGYTAALRDVGGVWTADRLDAWLANPRAFAPGTRMAFPGLANGVDRADVIAFLTDETSR